MPRSKPRFHPANKALTPLAVPFFGAERLPLALWAFVCITPIGVTGIIHFVLDLFCIGAFFFGWLGLVALFRYDPRAFSKLLAHLQWMEFYRPHTPLSDAKPKKSRTVFLVGYMFIQRLLRM